MALANRRKLLMQLFRYVRLVVLCSICFLAGYWLNHLNVRYLESKNHRLALEAEGDLAAASKTRLLVVFVISAPSNFDRRQTIRKTWFNDRSKSEVETMFVVGNEKLTGSLKETIAAENKSYKDLLLLPLTDTYSGLTAKVLRGFVQIERMLRFRYLLKVDDDTFVNLPVLVDELRIFGNDPTLYWGFFDGRAPILRKGKWAEKEYLLCDRYIPYALGGGYVLGANLIKYLARNKDDLKLFKNEDVSVGTWLAPLKSLHRVHDARFDTEYASRGCANDDLVSHRQSTKDMVSKYKSLKSSHFKVLCDKEYRVKGTYHYRWDVPPSQCCQRT